MENFIGIRREIVDHWIYKDSDYFKAWFEMLVRARYVNEPKTDIYEGMFYTLNYGEFIYGRPEWSKRLGIGEQKLRTLIRKLISSNMIALQKKYSKFTIYKIVNYEKYNVGGMYFECTSDVLQSIHCIKPNHHDNQQSAIVLSDIECDTNHHNNQQLTSSQPADNQQITTKEERKIDIEREINNALLKIENKSFEFGMSGVTPEFRLDAQQRITDGTDIDLILKALSIGATKSSGNTNSKCKYAISVLQSWAAEGIKTVEQWDEKYGMKSRDKPKKTRTDEKADKYRKAQEEAERILREQGVLTDD